MSCAVPSPEVPSAPLAFSTGKVEAGLQITKFTVKQAPTAQSDHSLPLIFHALNPSPVAALANPIATDLSGNLVWYYDTLHSGLTEVWPVRFVGDSSVLLFSATTTMQQVTNLDATAPAGTTYSTSMAVYDSLGAQHILTFNYTETAPNTWTYQVTLPAADTGGSGNPTVVSSGTLTFDSNGNLQSPTGSIPGINISGLADGAANLSLTWNLADSSGASLLTQVASKSTTTTTNQNGYASGTLQSYTVQADGTIEGTFTNGQTQALGQIALASFANVQGLEAVGSSGFEPSLASGAAVVGVPGAGGRGSLTGGALEMSNVDISTEFTRLIVIQRGFQANARMITTLDSIGNTTTNLQAQPGN